MTELLAEPVQAICINSSAVPQALQPIAAGIGQLLSLLSIFVGGVVGLYVLFLVLQWIERIKIYKKLKKIEDDLGLVKKKLRIRTKKKK